MSSQLVDSELFTLVSEALNNATDNGYPPHADSTEAIAVDLCTYDSELENYHPMHLYDAIDVWKAAQETK